jgi:uncharacterized membrane protein
VLTGPHRRRGDNGGSLMLMPAAVLVVLLLGAIALDQSSVYLAQRELTDLAASAANDATTFGLDPGLLRGGHAHLDRRRVEQAVARSIEVHALRGLLPDLTTIAIDPATGEVTVGLARHVDYFFAKSIPGANRGRDVTAHATAAPEAR